MSPETIYHLIKPHIEGYTDKEKEKLIKLVQGDKKLKALTKAQLEKLRIQEEVDNYFKRAQERNRIKRQK